MRAERHVSSTTESTAAPRIVVPAVSRDGRRIKTTSSATPEPQGARCSPTAVTGWPWLDFSDEGVALWIADVSAGTEGRITRPDQPIYGISWTPDDSGLVANAAEAGKLVRVSIDTRSGRDG